MSELQVGLVGAGPWAKLVHAPMLAQHPGTRLAGVWARRPEAAAEVAEAHGSRACGSVDELLDGCEAVAFAVPPDVQAELAVRAAGAGKALLLEKPVALSLDAARRLTDAVDAAGVGSQVLLTWRYAAAVREFLADVAAAEAPVGGRAHFLGGGSLAGPFATPWRIEHGPLLDLGPHVIDLLDAALGRVVGVRAHGDPRRWVGLLLEHESGAVSEASLTAHTPIVPHRSGVEVYTEAGAVEIDTAAAVGPGTMTTVVDELLLTASGTPHPLDVHRGLHLQQVIHDALRDL
ncbi:MAG TPA: Gfo/Idh/MocA family oxidoreductase [Acidimicrobiales bacterium]|nr:Gfo/Idh/MocA family oxidoreductase [Acidimicrobiales bacterium]